MRKRSKQWSKNKWLLSDNSALDLKCLQTETDEWSPSCLGNYIINIYLFVENKANLSNEYNLNQLITYC